MVNGDERSLLCFGANTYLQLDTTDNYLLHPLQRTYLIVVILPNINSSTTEKDSGKHVEYGKIIHCDI